MWFGQPDLDTVGAGLLPDSVILLTGFFLMFAGVLLSDPGDAENLRAGLIFLLVLIAFLRILEIVFIPRRAGRTVYVVTSKRVLSLIVTKKLNSEPDDPDEKQVLREEKSSPQIFYLANLPGQILMFLIAIDVLRASGHKFDPFISFGFGLMLLGWMRPALSDMRIPIASFREAPRTLYAIEDMFIDAQSLPRDQLVSVKLRRMSKDVFTVFIRSRASGCIRFRAVRGSEKANELVGTLVGPPPSNSHKLL